MKTLYNIISTIEKAPLNIPLWIAAFLSLIVFRVLIENWIGGFELQSPEFYFYEFTHTLFFFLFAYTLFFLILRTFLAISTQASANILLVGFFIILLPPILDTLLFPNTPTWSFYEFLSLNTVWTNLIGLFPESTHMGITQGVRIEIILSTIFIAGYASIKSRKVLTTLIVAFLAYLVFFLLGSFPTWVTLFISILWTGNVSISPIEIAQTFLTPAQFFSNEVAQLASSLNAKMSLIYGSLLLVGIPLWLLRSFPEKTKAFIQNARWPQLVYHGGLVSLGILLALHFEQASAEITFFNILAFFLLIGSIASAWLVTVIINDLSDQNIDHYSNSNRPLQKKVFTPSQYVTIAIILFSLSLMLSAIVHPVIVLLLIAYQSLAWLYSVWPFRLKRFPIIATFISAVASIMILFSGYLLISPSHSLIFLPSSLIWLLIIGYTVSLPIKDFKDIEGDRADGVWTLPVLLGEHISRLVIGAAIFLTYMLSIVVLNIPELFWYASLFGFLSFWIVVSQQNILGKKLKNPYLPWALLLFVALYGCAIVFANI